jgi:radical SAM protein with 4Fe4S-binding SPASM domain
MLPKKVGDRIGRALQRNFPAIFPYAYNSLIYLQDKSSAIKYAAGVSRKASFKKIDTLYFTVTNICNANCVFCPYEHLKDKKEVMGMDVFKKALDQFVEQGGIEAAFTPAYGEALVDPGLFDKIKYAKQKGVKKLFFFTNGILLDKFYKQVVESGLTRVVVSFAEFDKKKYCEVHRVGEAKYHSTLNGLIKFVKYNDEKKHPVHITLALRPSSKPKAVLNDKIFLEKIKPFIDEVAIMSVYNSHNGKVKQGSLKGIMRIRRALREKKYPCMMLYDSVSILPNGDVKLCGCTFDKSLNEFVIGNVKKAKLIDIYHGGIARRYRENMKSNPLCIKCTSYIPLESKNPERIRP